MMHVIILFRNFLHWHVISLKSIFMHKLGIISLKSMINLLFKVIEVNLCYGCILTLVNVWKDDFRMNL